MGIMERWISSSASPSSTSEEDSSSPDDDSAIRGALPFNLLDLDDRVVVTSVVVFEEPLALPKGTRLLLILRYLAVEELAASKLDKKGDRH